MVYSDLEVQITRCREQIENIMPHAYEHKLKEFPVEQKERDKRMAAEHGLNWPAVQRLEHLKSILEWAQSNAIKDK
ncbi:hypothetical protein N7447_006801 [Penicillium robsamsonii]|uniref:uncharacterized protein n=1 Tax=Penicillium robsamsonii TaxID=1792511 RepID=UPI0025469152|nr:uncharacterized protein N7447_006801 [Penicillium robsamsonii]KAJ5824461.1 hypothetical protein N7447_006801 [Penicillium robsamsonii]